MHVWDGECHVHAGIRPADISAVRAAHPDAEFMIHPECGCTTQVMEYVAAGDVDPERTHMLSTGGMLRFARDSQADTFIVATETGMLHPLEKENPGKEFIPANRAAACRYMKMITLPKLRDALRDLKPVVKVDPELAERARVPIDRMVAIGSRLTSDPVSCSAPSVDSGSARSPLPAAGVVPPPGPGVACAGSLAGWLLGLRRLVDRVVASAAGAAVVDRSQAALEVGVVVAASAEGRRHPRRGRCGRPPRSPPRRPVRSSPPGSLPPWPPSSPVPRSSRGA